MKNFLVTDVIKVQTTFRCLVLWHYVVFCCVLSLTYQRYSKKLVNVLKDEILRNRDLEMRED